MVAPIYDAPGVTYDDDYTYDGEPITVVSPTPAGATWGTGTVVVEIPAEVTPTGNGGWVWNTATPATSGGVEVSPTPAGARWNTSSATAGTPVDRDSLSTPWVNPLRNSLLGEDAVALNSIFDDLENFLVRPYFPSGLVVGNGTTKGVPPSVTRPIAADLIAPLAPTGLVVFGGIQSVVAKWNMGGEADLAGYVIEVDVTAGFTTPIQRTSGGNTSLVSGLTFGTTYYVRVKAVDTSGNASGWSSTQTGTPVQVTGPDIAVGSVTADSIFAGAVTTDKLAANAVTAGKIEAITISAAGIKVGTAVVGAIGADSISANMIQASSITADKISAGSIDATKITVGGITTATIADLAILESKIGSLAVTNSKVATGAINARTIEADTITANEISSLYIEVGKVIQSSNYDPGVAGWQIDGDGSAEFSQIDIRGSFYAGTGTGAAVVIDDADQATIRMMTGIGDWGAIRALSNRLQLASPWGQGGITYIDLYSSDATGQSWVDVNASLLNCHGDILTATGSMFAFDVVANHVVSAGYFAGGGLGTSAARLLCRSPNVVEFNWTGTDLEAYIDGVGPFTLT